MGQKNVDMIWVNFISGPDEEPVLECKAVMLHSQKSKIQEVFYAGLTVECLACNEGAEDLCAQDCELRADNSALRETQS